MQETVMDELNLMNACMNGQTDVVDFLNFDFLYGFNKSNSIFSLA